MPEDNAMLSQMQLYFCLFFDSYAGFVVCSLDRKSMEMQLLSRNDAVRLGARGVSPALFGVPPKTPPLKMNAPFGDGWLRRGRVGGTDWCDRDGRAPHFNCIVPA